MNVLDPNNSKHIKQNEATSVNVTDGQAVYTVPYALISTMEVKNGDAALVKDTDHTAAHDDDGNVVITLISESAQEAESLSISSTSLNPAGVTKEDIVGGVSSSTGAETGLELVRQIYPPSWDWSLVFCWPLAGPRSCGGGGPPGKDHQNQREFRLQHISGYCRQQLRCNRVHRCETAKEKLGASSNHAAVFLAQGRGGAKRSLPVRAWRRRKPPTPTQPTEMCRLKPVQ